MKFSIKDFFSKYDQILWSHLLKKSIIENFIFCVMCASPLKSVQQGSFKPSLYLMYRSSRLKVFRKKGVPRNFAKFRDSGTGVFL